MTHPNIVFSHRQRVEAGSEVTYTGVLPERYGKQFVINLHSIFYAAGWGITASRWVNVAVRSATLFFTSIYPSTLALSLCHTTAARSVIYAARSAYTAVRSVHLHSFSILFNHFNSIDAPDLPLMMLSRGWVEAVINTLRQDPRAARTLLLLREGGEISAERALTQAGRQLLDNTQHHYSDAETRQGTTIQWYSHLSNVDIDTNRMVGLTSMEFYTRLIDYGARNGGYVPKVTQLRGSCMFHSIRKSIACPREYSNTHLRRQVICFIIDNFDILWPMLNFSIKGNYGHLRLTPEEYAAKESDGTLTDLEREDYNAPGPFSVILYLEQLARPSFFGDEIVLLVISMMWRVRIMVINGQTLAPIKIRHRGPAMKADMILVHCNNNHYIPMHEYPALCPI